MQEKNRVLAYKKAIEWADRDIVKISAAAGLMHLTAQKTNEATGYYPGPLDVVVDQIWD